MNNGQIKKCPKCSITLSGGLLQLEDITRSERISLIASSQDPQQIQFEISNEVIIPNFEDDECSISEVNSSSKFKNKYEKTIKNLKMKESKLK